MNLLLHSARFVFVAAVAFIGWAVAATALRAADTWHVVVTNERSGDLTVIAAPSHAVVATIPVGKRPRGIRTSPDGRRLYVALSGSPISPPPKLDAKGNPLPDDNDNDEKKKTDPAADGVAEVDFATRRVLRKISSGSDPETLALSPDGARLYVTNEDAAAVSVIRLADEKCEHRIAVGYEPEGIELNPAGTIAYAACETLGEIHVIDTATHRKLTEFTLGGRPRTITFLPDGTRALIPAELGGVLHVIDAGPHRPLQTIALPAGARPMGVQLSLDARTAYVSTGRGGTVCAIDLATEKVRAVIKVGPRPWGIAVSPDGKFLYAANGPSNDVSVVDLVTEKEIARIPAGASPWGVAIVPTRVADLK